jgi:hypothetical protein
MRTKTASAANRVSTSPNSETRLPVASILAEPSPDGQPVSAEAIRLSAYKKWEAAGRPNGDGVNFWLEAERELSQAKQTLAGLSTLGRVGQKVTGENRSVQRLRCQRFSWSMTTRTRAETWRTISAIRATSSMPRRCH